jgi:hypothetical protein
LTRFTRTACSSRYKTSGYRKTSAFGSPFSLSRRVMRHLELPSVEALLAAVDLQVVRKNVRHQGKTQSTPKHVAKQGVR